MKNWIAIVITLAIAAYVGIGCADTSPTKQSSPKAKAKSSVKVKAIVYSYSFTVRGATNNHAIELNGYSDNSCVLTVDRKVYESNKPLDGLRFKVSAKDRYFRILTGKGSKETEINISATRKPLIPKGWSKQTIIADTGEQRTVYSHPTDLGILYQYFNVQKEAQYAFNIWTESDKGQPKLFEKAVKSFRRIK